MTIREGNNSLIFDNIYSDVWAYIEESKYRNTIVFAQNWTPAKNVRYNVYVEVTLTGVFVFESKKYDVARAYHPDFDKNGDPIDKAGTIIDEIEYKSKLRKEAMEKDTVKSPFSKLSDIKEKLPMQKVKIYDKPKRTAELKVGDKILRKVICFATGEKEVQDIYFENGKKEGYIIRASMQHNLFTDKAIISDNKTGLIVIIDNEPSENCIGFTITHIAQNGKCAWAKEVTGSFEWLKVFYKVEK